jgi:hypothetical protein
MISLRREWADPLGRGGAEFVVSARCFQQSSAEYARRPVRSIVLGFRLFDRAYRSPRIELQTGSGAEEPDRMVSLESLLPCAEFSAGTRVRVGAGPPARLFLEHLYTRYLTVTVWDGDSLFELGEARIPLAGFLRQGEPRIERTVRVAVRETNLRGSLFDDEARAGAVAATERLTSALAQATSVSQHAAAVEEAAAAVRGVLTLSVAHEALEVSERDEALLEHTLSHTVPSAGAARILGGAAQAASLDGGGTAAALSPHKSSRRTQGSPAKAALLVASDEPDAESSAVALLNVRANRPSRRRVKTLLDSERTDPAFAATLAGSQGMGALGMSAGANRSGNPLSRSGRSNFAAAVNSPIRRSDILNASLGASMGAAGIGDGEAMDTMNPMARAQHSAELSARSVNLSKLRALREASRASAIQSMLSSRTTALRTLQPRFGSTEFFEIAFRNPHDKRAVFFVRIDDPVAEVDEQGAPLSGGQEPECRVVTDVQEWAALKALWGLSTPLSAQLFDADRMSSAAAGPSRSSRSVTRGGGVPGSRGQDILSPTRLPAEESKEEFSFVPSSSSSRRGGAAADVRSDHTLVPIVLEAGETAFIPLKFQSFRCGNVQGDESAQADALLTAFPLPPGARVKGLGRQGAGEPIRHRIIQVNIDTHPPAARNAADASVAPTTLAYVRVDVRPQEVIVDRTLRFHHWSDDLLRERIELPRAQGASQSLLPIPATTDRYLSPSVGVSLEGLLGQSSRSGHHPRSKLNAFALGGASLDAAAAAARQANLHILASSERVVKAHCSSDDVAFDFVPADTTNSGAQLAGGGVVDAGAADLMFRVRLGGYPSLHRFLFALYADPWGASLHSVVEVVCTAHLRAELAATVGQRTQGRIFLPPTDKPRRVHMLSSSSELNFAAATGGVASPDHPLPPFLLQPGQVNTLDYAYHTLSPGRRSLLLHLVDADSHALVQSWALLVSATLPRVSNTFQVQLRCGPPHSAPARKAFDYENSYKRPRTFLFDSSAPDRVALRERELSIPPLGVRAVHLLVRPQAHSGTDTVFIFINDEQGKNEECLQFNITWKG